MIKFTAKTDFSALRALQKRLEVELAADVKKAAQIIAQKASQRAPKDSGDLKRSFFVNSFGTYGGLGMSGANRISYPGNVPKSPFEAWAVCGVSYGPTIEYGRFTSRGHRPGVFFMHMSMRETRPIFQMLVRRTLVGK